MADPLVSVIITTYNHEKYIRSAIEGCLMQKTSFPFEIIIHDDASTDNTSSIVREYAETYPHQIIPVIQEENLYNKGVKGAERYHKFLEPLVKGKYIAHCEGDDYWIDPLKLEKQVTVMEKDPSISMCFTAVRVKFANCNRKNRIKRSYKGSCYCAPKDIILGNGGFSDLVSIIIPADIYDDLPEWYHLSPTGDVALNFLAMVRGKVYYLDEVTATYRFLSPGSWTVKSLTNVEFRECILRKHVLMSETFDKQTDFIYHELIKRRITHKIKHFLIRNKGFIDYSDFYYERLSKREYFQVKLLQLLQLNKIWSQYMNIKRKILRY